METHFSAPSAPLDRPSGTFFTDAPFYRKLVSMALPIAFQALMLALVAACDAFMLGREHQDWMSSVSLATQIQFLQNMAVSAITSAATILGAQYWGKGDRESNGKIFRICLRSVGFISIPVALACIFLPELLMHAYTSEATLIELGAQYLKIAGFSYLLTGVSQSYLATMKVTNHVARSSFISCSAVVLNILLNALFIYGLDLGVRGAAWATLLSRGVELLFALLSNRGASYVQAQWNRILEPYPQLSADFRKCALPLLGGVFFWGIGFSSYTSVMGQMGTHTAAANAVSGVVRDLLCCVTDGMAAGGGILVGNELGAGCLNRGRIYGNRITILSIIAGLCVMGIILALAPFVPYWPWLKLSAEAQGYLRDMLVVLAIYMVGRCVNTVVINGVFSAGGDTLFDVYSLAVCMWGLAVPLAFLGAFRFGWSVPVVFACTCVDEVGKLPWVFLHYRRYKWVKDLTREGV